MIEAHYLFGPSYDDIEIVIHPQSIIHSMVETCDSSIIGQVALTPHCSSLWQVSNANVSAVSWGGTLGVVWGIVGGCRVVGLKALLACSWAGQT